MDFTDMVKSQDCRMWAAAQNANAHKPANPVRECRLCANELGVAYDRSWPILLKNSLASLNEKSLGL
jgi:hypothetical protein